MNKQQAIDTLKPIAYNLLPKYQWLNGKLSLLVAQVLVESGWLKHTPGNNCLGIKWTSKYPESQKQMLWTKEWNGSQYVSVKAPFVKFDSIEECIEEGYIRILSLNRYKQTREAIDWWEATNYIRLNGYATSPTYTNTLRKTILSNKLYEIDWTYSPEDNITENFKWGEVFSNVRIGWQTYRRIIEPPKEYCGNVLNLAIEMQTVRDDIGKPLVVTPNGGWYRQPSYNAQSGGTLDSQHLFGRACDIYAPRGYTGRSLYNVFRDSTSIKRCGIARNWIHVDIAEPKTPPTDIWYY